MDWPHGTYDHSDDSRNELPQFGTNLNSSIQEPPIAQEYSHILESMVGKVVFGQVVTAEDVAEQLERLRRMGL